jgi:hypothetical protein
MIRGIWIEIMRAGEVMITRRGLVTTAASAGATAAFVELRAAKAQSAADAWLYSTPQGPGSIRRDRSGQWIETTPTGQQFFFAETNVGAPYVELRDASRQMWLRLYSGYGEWRQEPGSEWHRWMNGRWGMSSEVPALSDYRIRLGYFIPSDRAPIANYEEKIGVILYFVTELYRQSFRARGFEMKDWPFQMRGGQPDIPVIRAAKPAAYYNGAPNHEPNSHAHWQRVVADIPSRFGVPQRNLISSLLSPSAKGQQRWNGPGPLRRERAIPKREASAFFPPGFFGMSFVRFRCRSNAGSYSTRPRSRAGPPWATASRTHRATISLKTASGP